MVGFGGSTENALFSYTKVFDPSSGLCDPKYPKTFCSNVTMMEVLTCGAHTGATMFSEDDKIIRGIVIRDSFCAGATQPGAYFHAISDYREWIDEVSGGEIGAKISLSAAILSAIFIAFKLMI
jgi:hypothetical protein